MASARCDIEICVARGAWAKYCALMDNAAAHSANTFAPLGLKVRLHKGNNDSFG
jgi:hypothetical protein